MLRDITDTLSRERCSPSFARLKICALHYHNILQTSVPATPLSTLVGEVQPDKGTCGIDKLIKEAEAAAKAAKAKKNA